MIGLGIIGTRVAAGLRAAGFQVYVWNRTAKPAPNFLGSPAEVALSAEVIQIFVADAAALFEVIEEMSEALTPRHVVICNATVGPEAVLEAARLVEARGAQFLDAPFTGSKIAAEKRQLVYYIGGAEATFLRAKPFLEATSASIVRIGEIGHASTVKVVTNMISAVQIQTLAEALCIVQKAGLEPEVLAAALENNACRSGVIDLKLPKMITGDYEPHFSLKHMFKDVQLGIHMANALDIEIPATTLTAGVMFGAINQGWGDLDFSVLYRNYAPKETSEELPALGVGENAKEASKPELTALPGSVVDSEPEFAGENGSEPVPLDSLEPLVASTSSEDSVLDEETIESNGSNSESKPVDEFARKIETVPAFGAEEPADTTSDLMSLPPELVVERNFANSETAPDKGDEPEQKATEVPTHGEVSSLSESSAALANAAATALADSGESATPHNFIRRWFAARPRN